MRLTKKAVLLCFLIGILAFSVYHLAPLYNMPPFYKPSATGAAASTPTPDYTAILPAYTPTADLKESVYAPIPFPMPKLASALEKTVSEGFLVETKYSTPAPQADNVQLCSRQADMGLGEIRSVYAFSYSDTLHFAPEFQRMLSNAVLQSVQSGQVLDYMCSVTYQSESMISCLVYIPPQNKHDTVIYLPFTFDLKSGRRIMLHEFFSQENIAWRSMLSEFVSALALQYDMALLSDVMPISPTHPYFITDEHIALLYRPYEITAEADFSCFMLPVSLLCEYMTGAYGIGGTEK